MIAYNNGWLKNLAIREQATVVFKESCLDKDELEKINERYPEDFYTPNIFIRIGLFLLTFVIVLFSFGIIALLFRDAIDNMLAGLAVFFGLVAYAALEFMVQSKNHYRSGVDEALMWASAGFLFGGVSYLSDAGDLGNSMLVFIISIYCALRFTDRAMTVVSYISLLCIFFFTLSPAGNTLKAMLPFILMAVSAGVYFLSVKARQFANLGLYADTLQIAGIAALLGFYFAGNYYVVRELTNELFSLHLAENETIPFGWLFWIFTFAIPVLYLARGIQKKDIVLIRVGLLLLAAIVFTVKYYYHIASIETTMTVCGMILLGVSYLLIQYLKKPKHGFTYLDESSVYGKEKLEIESFILAQTFTPHQAAADPTKFGGGSFGGGGSSGEF